MKILGIESSCDETAASMVEDGRVVLSDVVASQVKEHMVFGGVVPEVASRMHAQAISAVVKQAFEQANCTLKDIDAVAVTYAPGLIGALLVGVNFAKGLAYSNNLPLVPVHHLRSHIAANYITYPDLEPPFLCLVVSGGNTCLVDVRSYTDFKVLGKTRDDAAGEALDKAARCMGLPYPGGLNMDKFSRGGDDRAFDLPHPRPRTSPLDFSFSGLKTAVVNIIHNASQKSVEINKKDLGASFQRAVVDCLTENTEKAVELTGYKKLVLAGGVSANSVLRRETDELSKKLNIELFYPELKYCGDNAAMVAAQGYYEFLSGKRAQNDLNAVATLDIEECGR